MASVDINTLVWPMAQLGEALHMLARERGIAANESQTFNPPGTILAAEITEERNQALREWVEAAADCHGFEAEAIEAPYSEIENLARGAAPALLRLPGQRVLAVLAGKGSQVSVLAPDGNKHRVRVETISADMRRPHEEPLTKDIARLLEDAGVSKSRRERATKAVLGRQLGSRVISGGWILRLSPGASFWKQM